MALKLPPKSHTMMRDGRSAAWAFEESGHGRREKKTTSISLTMLCESIAKTVGSARRRIVLYRPSPDAIGAARSSDSIRYGTGEFTGSAAKLKPSRVSAARAPSSAAREGPRPPENVARYRGAGERALRAAPAAATGARARRERTLRRRAESARPPFARRPGTGRAAPGQAGDRRVGWRRRGARLRRAPTRPRVAAPTERTRAPPRPSPPP